MAVETKPDFYRKKPIEVQAIQWTGDNADAITAWAGVHKFAPVDPEDRGDDPAHTAQVFVDTNSTWVGIEVGEWIVRDRNGVYCPCKADVFAETYEQSFLRDDDFDAACRVYVGYDDNATLVTRDDALLVGRLKDWEREDAPSVCGIAALPRMFTMSPAAALFACEPSGENG